MLRLAVKPYDFKICQWKFIKPLNYYGSNSWRKQFPSREMASSAVN